MYTIFWHYMKFREIVNLCVLVIYRIWHYVNFHDIDTKRASSSTINVVYQPITKDVHDFVHETARF